MDLGNDVRLVHCPECANLLPELPHFTIYKCGGCGALLRAKKKGTASGASSENPRKEGKDFLEKFEKLEFNLGKESGKCQDGLTYQGKERDMKQRAAKLFDSSVSRVETKRDLANDDAKRNVKGKRLSYPSGLPKGTGYVGRSSQLGLKRSLDNWGGPDEIAHINGYGSVKGSLGYSKTGTLGEWLSLDEEGGKGFYGKLRIAGGQRKMPSFAYPDEGSSKYPTGLRGFSNQGRVYEEVDRPKSLAHLRQDRTELLWKLDELKTELHRRLGPMAEKKRAGCHIDNRSAPQSYNRQCGCGPVHPRHYDINLQNFYAFSKHAPTEIPCFDEPLQAQACQCQKRPSQDPYMIMSRRPAGSCFCCYSENAHTSLQFPPIDSGNMRFTQDQERSCCNCKYTTQNKSAQLHFRDPQPVDRWQRNIDLDIDAFHYVCPRRVPRCHGNRRHWRPVAGGAPLLTCCNCHELLTLPKELSMRGKKRQKLQCGACSIVLSLVIENQRLCILPATQMKHLSDRSANACLNNDDETYRGNGHNSGQDFISAECKENVLSNNQKSSSDVCPTTDGVSHADSRGDDKNSGPGLLSADCKDDRISDNQTLNSIESHKKRDFASLPFSSTDEQTADGMTAKSNIPNCLELTKKHEELPKLQRLLFQDCSDDASCNEVGDRLVMENMSKQIDLEVILGHDTSSKNLVKDVIVPEMEASFDVYLDASLPQDLIEVHEEDKRSKRSKKAEPFLMGASRKRLKDLSISSDIEDEREPSVFVNGQLIPRHALIKAEKLAGCISPGNYWYDSQSGFWGVIGKPCLGIIPPFIKEFAHLMPANCAAGNTSVYVNGRELNREDLNLLASKGLPTTKEKSYTIESCGRVLDRDSGEEIANLGKLAPTVEHLKRGFGMRVPPEICD